MPEVVLKKMPRVSQGGKQGHPRSESMSSSWRSKASCKKLFDIAQWLSSSRLRSDG